jgi:two-component system response regulator GlrR
MATNPAKVLVVDDDRNLLEIIKMRLELSEYKVVTVLKEEEAFNALKEQAFDLSIIDLQLAERNGISVMEDVHKIIPNLPVIIITAYGSIESAVEAIQKGACNYITKPFESKNLLSQIKKALESSRKSN